MISIFCADVGSVRNQRFGWAGQLAGGEPVNGCTPSGLVEHLAAAVMRDEAVALGFECPLFVPVPQNEDDLGKARLEEGNRAWSAGAGSGALATGLVEVAWIARELRRKVPHVIWTLDAPKFAAARAGVLVWEAFVSGPDKTSSHCGDARAAIEAFSIELQNGLVKSHITCDAPLSLVGAALVFAGSRDARLLQSACYAVKARRRAT